MSGGGVLRDTAGTASVGLLGGRSLHDSVDFDGQHAIQCLLEDLRARHNSDTGGRPVGERVQQ